MDNVQTMKSHKRVWALAFLSEILSLASMILTGVWMSHYHHGYNWQYRDPRKFNYHPLFMAIAFVGFAPKAALMFRLFPSVSKFWVKIIHFVLQLSAIISAATGLAAVVQYHNEFGYKNFYSVHSWLGLVAISLFCIQLIGGFVSFLFPKLPDGLRAKVAKWHAFLGRGILLVALLTFIVGVSRKTSLSGLHSLEGEQILANCLTLVLTLFFGLTFFITMPQHLHSSGSYESF